MGPRTRCARASGHPSMHTPTNSCYFTRSLASHACISLGERERARERVSVCVGIYMHEHIAGRRVRSAILRSFVASCVKWGESETADDKRASRKCTERRFSRGKQRRIRSAPLRLVPSRLGYDGSRPREERPGPGSRERRSVWHGTRERAGETER